MRYPPTVLANDETSARNSFRSLWLFPGRSRLYSMVFRSETRLSIKVWRSISAISASGLLKSIISTPLLFVVVSFFYVRYDRVQHGMIMIVSQTALFRTKQKDMHLQA